MATNTTQLFGIHEQALRVHSERLQVLASNIANADTPNFRAKDLDFVQLLRSAAGESDGLAMPVGTNSAAAEIPLEPGQEFEQIYRVPLQPSVDGNTVDTQLEYTAFAESAVHYQASLMFLESRMRSMITAIRGD